MRNDNAKFLLDSAGEFEYDRSDRVVNISGRALRFAANDIERLSEALSKILWVKDCGIDGRDEQGVYRNWPEEERDAMYALAKEALGVNPSTPLELRAENELLRRLLAQALPCVGAMERYALSAEIEKALNARYT